VSYYDVLGVAPDSSVATIRRAYVELARRYHPDFHTTDDPRVRAANEQAMKALNEAWAVLSDPVARRRYDAGGTPGRGVDGEDRARRAREREAAWAAAEDERHAWRPYDESDDELDPRLLADDPARVVVTRRRQLATVAPTLCFGAGVLLVVFGAIVRLLPVAVLGGVAIAASVLLFVILPLLELSASARNDRR
jgi:DnaJ-domain-containing protein 1